MWVLVLDAVSGTTITNASFSINFYNRGDGYYWVYFSYYNQGFTASAPGHNTFWGSDDSYNGFTLWLSRIVPPPPPPPNCSCWS